MGTRRLDITCIVSVHYTIPLQCWENGVSWWQSLELQEQCHLDPAGIMATIVDPAGIVATTVDGHREVGHLAPYHGRLALFGHPAPYHGRLGLGHQDIPTMAVDPPLGDLDLDMAVDPTVGPLDLPPATATPDKAVAQNEQDNDNAWLHWTRKIAFIV